MIKSDDGMAMYRTEGKKSARIGAFLLAAAATVWFLAVYGPAEAGLRVLILAAGILIALAAAFRPVRGLSIFLFFLLTANNWPYYFQARHGVFYVRIAAVLFLFLAAGWTLGRVFVGRKNEDAGGVVLPGAIGRPVALAAALILLSAGIAFWRWANFFPVWGSRVFEWMVNSNGVPAGLARRGVVMSAAGYLLPLAFLAIAARMMRNRTGVETALRAVSLGLGAAVLFGHVQHFAAPSLGNTDFWVTLGQVNGTFIDPNAFGAVLAIMLPMLLASAWDGLANVKGDRKAGLDPALAGGSAVLGMVAFLWIGARSAVLAFAAAMVVLAVGGFRLRNGTGPLSPGPAADINRTAASPQARVISRTTRRRRIAAAAVILLVAGGVLFFRSRLFVRLKDRVREASAAGDLLLLSPERYFLWKHALAMTRDYPLSGVGVGAFIVEIPDYYALDKDPVPAGFEGYQRLDSAENFFLQASAETGLIGLAVWLAVFIGLAWEIRRAVRAGILRGPDRRLYAGAAGGLTGFFVNSLFHSFTQSFETLFCFLFAAAVLVVLGGRGDGEGRRPERRGPPPFLVFSAGVVLVFGFSGLRDSTRELSIAGKSTAFGIAQEFGLYHPEKDEAGMAFRWTRDDAAWSVEIKGPSLRLPVQISHPDVAERPVRVKVFLGKELLGEEILLREEVWTAPGRKILEYPVPPGYAGKAMIHLLVDRTWIPSEFTESKDSRRLGAAVGPLIVGVGSK